MDDRDDVRHGADPGDFPAFPEPVSEGATAVDPSATAVTPVTASGRARRRRDLLREAAEMSGGVVDGAPVNGSDLTDDFDAYYDRVVQEWQEQALCAQTDPEAFFPEKGGSTREAKRICRACSVRDECLEYALEHDERFGIWGGLSERERRRLKKRLGQL